MLTSVFFSKYNAICSAPLQTWLILMLIHDTFNIFYVITHVFLSASTIRRRGRLPSFIMNRNHNNHPEENFNPHDPNNQDYIENNCKCLHWIREINFL